MTGCGVCRTDLGQEYARKLEQLRREEELIQEEALEAEAYGESVQPSMHEVWPLLLRTRKTCQLFLTKRESNLFFIPAGCMQETWLACLGRHCNSHLVSRVDASRCEFVTWYSGSGCLKFLAVGITAAPAYIGCQEGQTLYKTGQR